MAKSKNALIKLSGTLYDATFVDSKKYGRHVRSPRGTYKKAKVNHVLADNAKKTDLINSTAKVIHDHIKSIAGSFKQSDLWQDQLLSRMRKVNSTVLPDLLASVQGLEINGSYPLNRLMNLPSLELTINKSTLCLDMTFLGHPDFDKKISADSYYYTFHLLYIDKNGEAVDSDGIETEWVQLQDEVPSYALSFKVPVKAQYYLLFLEIDAGLDNVPLDMYPAKGMRVMVVGKINT